MVRCNKNDSQNSCRSFKVVGSGIGYVSPPSSYYKGKDPLTVANKFGSMMFRLINDKNGKYYSFRNKKNIKIIVKETTKGSLKNTFYYNLKRVELPKPITRTLPNGTVIVNKYKIHASKCDADNKDIL